MYLGDSSINLKIGKRAAEVDRAISALMPYLKTISEQHGHATAWQDIKSRAPLSSRELL